MMLIPQGSQVSKREFDQTIYELRDRISQLEKEIADMKQAEKPPKRPYTRRVEQNE